MIGQDESAQEPPRRSIYRPRRPGEEDAPAARDDVAALQRRLREMTRANDDKDRKLRQLRQVCADLRDQLRTLDGVDGRTKADAACRETKERFQQIANAIDDVVWITEPDERRIVYVSPSYERLWGRSDEFRQGCIEDWIATIHLADRERIRESLRNGLFEGRYDVEYRIIRPDGRLLWIRDRGFAVSREEGLPRRMVGIATDITERKQADAALAASEEQSRAQLGELNAIYDTAPVGLCVLDQHYHFVRINTRMAEMNGSPVREHFGRTLRDIIPDMADDAEAMVRRILATGEVGHAELRGETAARPGIQRIWDTAWFPLRGARGDVIAVNVVANEVTEQKQAEEHRELLLRELNHRVRNTLAIVQSVAEQTANSSESIVAYKQTLACRLTALSRTHGLLTRDGWTSAPLRDVLRETLAPYEGRSDDRVSIPRIVIEGPDAHIRPTAVITLSMALHELATNAAKYGSLSTPSGRVAARWAIAKGADGKPQALDLTWEEKDGPSVSRPVRRGFGTRLIEEGLARQLEAQVALDFDDQGLRCGMRLPAARVLAA